MQWNVTSKDWSCIFSRPTQTIRRRSKLDWIRSQSESCSVNDKYLHEKLSYRRGTARRAVLSQVLRYLKDLNAVAILARTAGTVAIWTNPSVSDASHLPDGVIVRRSRISDVTGNSYDVMVACYPHAGLHRGIDAADHCSRYVTKYPIRFDMTSPHQFVTM